MLTIAPIKPFLVDYKINNPSDSSTYYVRAVIKNSVSGATLATLNLTDNGSKYFSYTWTTPPDMSGTGLQVTIFKTVYTDSGYTTESEIYGTTVENYIVRDVATRNLQTGASGKSLGKKDIEEVVQKVLSESLPEKEDVVGRVGEMIRNISEELKGSLGATSEGHSKNLMTLGAKLDEKSIESMNLKQLVVGALTAMQKENKKTEEVLAKAESLFNSFLMIMDSERKKSAQILEEKMTSVISAIEEALGYRMDQFDQSYNEKIRKLFEEPVNISFGTKKRPGLVAKNMTLGEKPDDNKQGDRQNRINLLINSLS